jgi:hypothetical protein
MLRRIVAASAVALFAVPAARAQDLVAICQRAMHPAVGAWSQYRMVGGREDGATLRMSVVGRESHDGTAYLWIEVAARGFRMGPGGGDTLSMISKMLAPGFGPGLGQARAHIVKIGSARAMEMPVRQARTPGAPGADVLANCRTAKVIGWERVTVPAGTFRALHIVNAQGKSDTWVNPDLPLAFVKSTTSEGAQGPHQMVLAAHGTGAKSQITETPQPYDPRLYMQMMPGGRMPRR